MFNTADGGRRFENQNYCVHGKKIISRFSMIR